jgi:GTP-binding protein
VAINKWDLVEEREGKAKDWEATVRERLRFVKEVPFVLVSAKSGQRVTRILDCVDTLFAEASKRVPTPALNTWLQEESVKERRAPAKGGSVRLFYATQTGIRPPRFVVFCNEARRLHFSLRRHLENSLRARFGFGAAPLRLTAELGASASLAPGRAVIPSVSDTSSCSMRATPASTPSSRRAARRSRRSST